MSQRAPALRTQSPERMSMPSPSAARDGPNDLVTYLGVSERPKFPEII